MTDHPDIEALSANLDGEAPEWDAHIRGCADCQRQRAALDQVRVAVGGPVRPADPARREQAVAAALAGGAHVPRRRVTRWTLVAGIAAVAVGTLVGVVATRDTRNRPAATTAAAQMGPVSSDLVDGGNLGEVDSDAVLRQKLEPRLLQASGSVASAEADNGGGAQPGGSVLRESPAAARATVGAERAATRTPQACEREARALQPGTEVLVYVATATWQGSQAVVLGFSPPGAPATAAGRPAPTRVYVLARSGCRLLSFQSYAP